MEKVQKESRSESDWTLELWEARKSPKEKSTRAGLDFKVENPQKSPKQASQSIIHILTIR